MEKELLVKRSDLAVMQLHLIPKLGVNYVFFGFLFVCAGGAGFSNASEAGYTTWFIISLITSVVVFVVMFFIGTVIQLLTATAEKGFIGKTVFSFSDEGFKEKTDGTETLTKWGSIKAIYRNKSYTFVRINGYRIHIIPRREFDSEDEFNSFSEKIFSFWANA